MKSRTIKPTRRGFLAITGAALVTARPAVAASPDITGLASPDITWLEGAAFGSTWRISICGRTAAGEIAHAINAVIAAVDRAMSPYRRDSEVSAFNRARGEAAMPISPPLRHVVAHALKIAHDTAGAFDPTVGPIVAAHGFGPIRGQRTGTVEHLHLTAEGLAKDRPDLTVDLCGIAKGYALDRICDTLADAGFADWFVEVGGEIRAAGRHPAGRPWQAGIAAPPLRFAQSRTAGERARLAQAVSHVVSIDNMAVATSGDAVNSYKIAGRRISHIVDPAAAAPADNAIASVSLAAPSAMTTDARATAVMAMPGEAGLSFARAHGWDALFLIRNGERLETHTTGAFADWLVT